MAQNFVLVPFDNYQRLMSRSSSSQRTETPNLGQTQRTQQPEIHVLGAQPEADDLLSTVADLMPKHLRAKAKLLMHYVNGHIQIDDQNRVVYAIQLPDGTTYDQTGSSHFLDLVKYFVSPSSHFGQRELSVPRPVDAPRFAQVLLGLGVPCACLGTGKRLEEISSIEEMSKPMLPYQPREKKRKLVWSSKRSYSKRKYRS